MKQRYSSLDVKVIAHELSNALCTLRLANVYDLSSRIFLLKFAKPNHKEQVIVDSGFRCHLTNFARATATAPSAFVTRLRKFLKTRRVTSVSQIGTDRIIELQFSDGQYRLFLEFYAGGNIVLTDKDLNILALFRIVSGGTEQEELRIGLKYSLERRQNVGGVPVLTKERVRNGLQNAFEKAQNEPAVQIKKSKKKAGDVLRKALSSAMTEFPSMLIEHALRVTSFDPETPIDKILSEDSMLENLLLSLQEAQKVIDHLTISGFSRGYIIAKPLKSQNLQIENENLTEISGANVMYEDFHPFKPAQFEGIPDVSILEFEGFNRTVDEFFSSIEAQKLESRLTEREEDAKKKLEAVRQDHDKRLGGLQQVQELNTRRAQAIEANLQRVHEAIAAVNGLIAQGMDWVEVARLIEMEQARQNPVAEMIKLPLKLYENTITLLLAEDIFDDDDYVGDETDSDVSISEDEKTTKGAKLSKDIKPADKRLAIDVDLALSPWSNARQYYNQKKTAAVKEQKTLQSSTKVLKNTERKINSDLKKSLKQEKEVLRPILKQLWFEKFYFFISSDGYLVLGGKDVQQSEILYKKYLRKGDVYVHADLQGAASVVIMNKVGMSNSPIPPSTLSQAGTFSVATSNAWESKAVMAAWWVNYDQISKTVPTGDYLSTGAFHIRGQKNFLPPAQLLLGFGVIFQINEESKARHLKHRVQDIPASSGPLNEGTRSQEDVTTGNTEDGDNPQSHDEHMNDDHDGESSHEDFRDSHSNLSDTSSNVASDNGDEDEDHAALSEHENPLQTTATDLSTSQTDILDQLQTVGRSNDDGLSEGEQLIEDNASTGKASVSENPTSGIRHMSAKERRLLRADHDPANPSNTSTDPSSQPVQPAHDHPNPSTKLASHSHVRGKHLKTRKIKTKYANQDEEDRALALRLLGSSTAARKTVDDAVSRATKERELAAQKERRREQHLRVVEKGLQDEEKRKARLEGEDTADDEGEDEEIDLSILDSCIGTPLPTDKILDALIVCGPWDSIGSRCRYKAKLQPGTLKKGKAVREILGRWVEMGKRPREKGAGEEEERVRKRETELIKQVRDVEVIGCVPVGRCRVVMAGGEGRDGNAVKGGKRGGRGSKRR